MSLARWRILGRAALLVAGSAFPGGTRQAEAQAPSELEAFKHELARMADGAWIASNAEYRDQDGGIEAYGVKLHLAPGGVAAVGCLWGETGGEVVGVYWQFFEAWDPVQGKGMVYQSSPRGAIGIGYMVPDATDDEPQLIQEFFNPDGTRTRTAHRERWPDADTRVGGSLDFVDGRWTPRRSYTWVRDRDRHTPC